MSACSEMLEMMALRCVIAHPGELREAATVGFVENLEHLPLSCSTPFSHISFGSFQLCEVVEVVYFIRSSTAPSFDFFFFPLPTLSF